MWVHKAGKEAPVVKAQDRFEVLGEDKHTGVAKTTLHDTEKLKECDLSSHLFANILSVFLTCFL